VCLLSNKFYSLFSDVTSVMVCNHVNNVVVSCKCNSQESLEILSATKGMQKTSRFQQYVIYGDILRDYGKRVH